MKKNKRKNISYIGGAGNVEQAVQFFNNAQSGGEGISMAEAAETKPGKKIFQYIGPIYYKGQKIADKKDLGYVTGSMKQAIVFFRRRAAKKDNISDYDIIPEYIQEVKDNQDDDVSDIFINDYDKYCEKCGTKLTDSGECPVCDYGEEDFFVYDELDNLVESSVKRVQHHLDVGNPMAMVSAYRSNQDKQTNEMNDKELRKFARMTEFEMGNGAKIKAEFGFVPTLGGYAEGGNRVVSEKSILLIADKSREKELLDFALAMGERYNQDSVLIIDSNGEAYYISTNDEEDNWIGPKGTKKYVGNRVTQNEKEIDELQGFSQINRKSKQNAKDLFAFTEDFELDDDFSANSKSIPNRVMSGKMKFALKQYGKDFLNYYK